MRHCCVRASFHWCCASRRLTLSPSPPLQAAARALRESPSLVGHIALGGNFYPSSADAPTVAQIVPLDSADAEKTDRGGVDTLVMQSPDRYPLPHVVSHLAGKVEAQSARRRDLTAAQQLVAALPAPLQAVVVGAVRCASLSLGWDVPALGASGFPFGNAAVITTVGGGPEGDQNVEVDYIQPLAPILIAVVNLRTRVRRKKNPSGADSPRREAAPSPVAGTALVSAELHVSVRVDGRAASPFQARVFSAKLKRLLSSSAAMSAMMTERE